jgi:cytochrome c-type biogenesis protein CcmF
MTEAAIDTNVVRDVFVALGEPLGDNAWSLRLQVKPLIGFLWLGSGLMVLGGLVALTDRRYRAIVRQTQQATVRPATGAA